MLYLLIIVVGGFGELFVRDRLIVTGDATATAANITSLESLWRFHIAAELFLLICAVALLLILFVLLKPVSRHLALLAVFLNLVSIGLEAATTLYLLVALFPLGNAGYLKAFAPEQLYAMASLSLKSHSYGFGVSLIFFGCFCLVIGYLNARSGYLPKTLGVLTDSCVQLWRCFNGTLCHIGSLASVTPTCATGLLNILYRSQSREHLPRT